MDEQVKYRFEIGKKYYAEFPIYCLYKGYMNQVGYNYGYAECIKKTDKRVTFKITNKAGKVVYEKKSVAIKIIGAHDDALQEYAFFKESKNIKHFSIESEQTA